jgi:7-carboxy-7-deazaguanine synthase
MKPLKNNQPAEKPSLLHSGELEINSIFYTIQGEGPFAGRRALFIRLAGCNLQCSGCDTEYSNRTFMNLGVIHRKFTQAYKNQKIVQNPYTDSKMLVVITGGEPFRQNIAPLIEMLLDEDCDVQIETNGTLYQELPFHNITIVCSPKTGRINEKLYPHIDAFKYVITAGQVDKDGLPLSVLGHPVKNAVAKPRPGSKIYVQAADEQDIKLNKANLMQTIESVKTFEYTLCVQLHKIAGLD